MPLLSFALIGWLDGQMPPSGSTHVGTVFLAFAVGGGDDVGTTTGSVSGSGIASGGQGCGGTPGATSSEVVAGRGRKSRVSANATPASTPSHNPMRSERRIIGDTVLMVGSLAALPSPP